MNEAVHRRGPDEDGYFLDRELGLAMKRLSILDLAGGHQPIFNEDRTVCVVFNGEIYNFRSLRSDLEKRGHRFSTNSDTEVLVHLYEEYGNDLVKHLRGMFAFALWDRRKRSLLIARDRLGIKPLFYAYIGGNLIFGSEIKCLLQCPLVDKKIDWQAVDAFFAYTYIPAPHTIFQQIRKLEPGTLLVADSKGIRTQQYWDLDFSKVDRRKTESQWIEDFEAAIRDAVDSHLISDVPLGAFLSGGIDSGLVSAMMSGALEDLVETFTMWFDGGSIPLLDERPYAKALATQYHLKYNELTVQPDFRDIADDIVQAFDEPFADDSVIPSYYISKLTRQHVKVALSGLGGDELFGGYHRYQGFLLSKYYCKIPASLHTGLIDPLLQRLPEPRSGSDRIDHIKRFSSAASLGPAERYTSYVSTLSPLERRQLYAGDLAKNVDYDYTTSLITRHFLHCNSDDDVDRMLYTDIKTYLPDDILALSDRLSMWHSLELRVPFADHPLVELSATLPSSYKIRFQQLKVLLKKVAKRSLPDETVNHRKQGFESPMASWLKNDLTGYVDSLLQETWIEELGLFRHAFIREKWQEHLQGRRKNNKMIFSILMFHLWAKRYVY